MDTKYFKYFILIICCFMFCGCSNIKVNKELQLDKKEVIDFVKKDIESKYDDVEVELVKEEDAYTADKELIKKGNYYYFKLTDKNGNIAYASYRDAFSIGEEKFDYSYIESYGILNKNNELDYYIHLTDMYINEEDVVDKYFAADYENLDLYSKAKIVYKLNYKLEDMTREQYFDFMKLGYDLRKYRISKYGIINYDDPEVCFIFKGDKKYYYASYYGLADLNNNYYKVEVTDSSNNTDKYNIKSKVNFKIEDEELNKVINDFNNIGNYVMNNITDIKVKSNDKFAYILVENYTKNTYLMNLMFRFKYDSKTDSYKYESMNVVDTNKLDDFEGYVVNTWKNY